MSFEKPTLSALENDRVDAARERTLMAIERNLKWVLTLPAILLLLGLMVYPVIRALYMSLFSYRGATPEFIGHANYAALITDSALRHSLWVTAQFTFVSVAVSMILGFAVAMLLNRKLKFRGTIQTLTLIPIIVSPTVIGLLWELMYQPNGVANAIIAPLIGRTVPWLSDPSIALWAIVLADIWQWTPLVVLVILAGLQAIPQDITEAAIMDGASRYRRFVDITLPYMRQLIVLLLIIRTIGSMREFAKVYVMTRGGPGSATNVISIHLYHEAFRFGNWGRASAMAIILLVIVLGIAWVFVKMARIKF